MGGNDPRRDSKGERDHELSGKVAVITGASRGVGAAIARVLARHGAKLTLMARTAQGRPSRLPGTLEETALQCRLLGADVIIAAGDVRVDADCRRAAEMTEEQFGRCDLLVNNAAINPIGLLHELPIGLFIRCFEVNVFGPVMMMKAFFPLLRRTRGHIVNISSAAARLVQPEWSAYAASKAALDAISMTAAEEMKSYGIKVADLQIEIPLTTPGYATNQVEDLYPNAEPPELAGEMLLRIVTAGDGYSGRVVTLGELKLL